MSKDTRLWARDPTRASSAEFTIALNRCNLTTSGWTEAAFPDGIAGPSIPAEARIVAVVDAFDAMTTNRATVPAEPNRSHGRLRAAPGAISIPKW